jgi:protein-S-isoprenylcysteine O-methyltransferase Ste14
LLSRKPFLFLTFIILIPIQIYRARKEQKILENKFGVVYTDHLRDTLV